MILVSALRRGWTRARRSSEGVTGSTEVREDGDPTVGKARTLGQRHVEGEPLVAVTTGTKANCGPTIMQDEARRCSTTSANRCLQPVSNPASAHLSDALLSAAAALAACLAFAAVLYAYAPVEWPTFDAARVVAQDEP